MALIAAIRSRRACRVSDATGINLACASHLRERHLGLISDYDPRLEAWDPARCERAAIVREMRHRSLAIERYLSRCADALEAIAATSATAPAGLLQAWNRSRKRTQLMREAPAVILAMRRAAGSTSLLAEYGAARSMCVFAQRYQATLAGFASQRISNSIQTNRAPSI